MENRLSIIIRSFLRISIIPIIVFYLTALLTLFFHEPGLTRYGCFSSPENPKNDLVFGALQLLIYTCFTPILFLNLFKTLSKVNLIRNTVLLIPIVPAIVGLFVNFNLFLSNGGRSYVYLSITAVFICFIVIWNAKIVSNQLKNE